MQEGIPKKNIAKVKSQPTTIQSTTALSIQLSLLIAFMAKVSTYITGKFVTINIELAFASATHPQAFLGTGKYLPISPPSVAFRARSLAGSHSYRLTFHLSSFLCLLVKYLVVLFPSLSPSLSPGRSLVLPFQLTVAFSLNFNIALVRRQQTFTFHRKHRNKVPACSTISINNGRWQRKITWRQVIRTQGRLRWKQEAAKPLEQGWSSG